MDCERVAERVGFEPTVLAHTAFRERHLQPLGHLSVEEDTKAGRRNRRTPGREALARTAGPRPPAGTPCYHGRAVLGGELAVPCTCNPLQQG